MDPFKKSLGINFGPLFSVTVNPSKKEAGLEIDKNKGEKESSPKLQKLRTPGGTPKPDIDVIGGFEVVGWEWVSTSSPLEPGGYWKPVLGWPVEKDIRLPDPPPPGMRFGSGGGSGNTTSQEDEHPCVEKRKEVEERKGVRIIRDYTKPCGSDKWNCQETWIDTSGKSKGIGFKGGNKSTIIKIQPCENECEPHKWGLYGAASSKPDKSFQEKIKAACSRILQNIDCLNDLIPGLGDCIKKAYAMADISYDRDGSSCLKGNELNATATVAYREDPYQLYILFCKDTPNLTVEEIQAQLLHELVHACGIIRNNINIDKAYSELDASVIENYCGGTGALSPEKSGYLSDWFYAEGKIPKLGKYQIFEMKVGNPTRTLYYSTFFIWDPATGEVWVRDNPAINPNLLPFPPKKKIYPRDNEPSPFKR